MRYKYTRKEIIRFLKGFAYGTLTLQNIKIVEDIMLKTNSQELQDEIQEDTTSMEEKLEALDKLK